MGSYKDLASVRLVQSPHHHLIKM